MLLAAAGCATRKMNNSAQNSTGKDVLLASLLQQNPAYFDSLLQAGDRWKIRIIYTQIDRDEHNQPVFTDHVFRTGPESYFYPASTVKMPVAALALQRMHQLSIPGLDRESTMITEAGYPGQTEVCNDPSSSDGRPTVSQYIRKIFLVSDNDAFNRLYEFLGQEYINQTLHGMGYDSVQVIHHLDLSMSEEENRWSNPVKFLDTSGQVLFSKPAERSNLVYQQRHTLLGKGYLSNGHLVDMPFDFSHKNRFPLSDLHMVLRSLLFPESVPAKKRFELTQDDYDFIYRYMSMKPQESDFPQYDSSFPGAYSKLLVYGGRGEPDPSVRIFNKEGDAYGFLTDVAYVVDFEKGVEFMLTASIYCNSDGIFNDDHYDYEQVGFPFLKHLGEVIYQYECNRKRKFKPDLSRFKMDYRK
jgi:hypothetical protein